MPQDNHNLALRARLRLSGRLLRRVLSHRSVITVALISMIVCGLARTAPIALAKIFVDAVLLAEPGSSSPFLERTARGFVNLIGHPAMDLRLAGGMLVALGILSVGVIGAMATYANEFAAKYLGSLIVRDLRKSLMERVLGLPMAWFTRRKLGDLISRFSNDSQVAYLTVNLVFSEIMLQPFVVLASLAGIFWINAPLGIFACVFVPGVMWPVVTVGRRIHKRSRKTLVSLGETMESVNQTLAGMRVVRAFRREDHELARFGAINDQWLTRMASLLKAKALSRAVQELLYAVALALVVAGGGFLVVEGGFGVTSGDLAAFLLALATLYRAVRRLSNAYHMWQESLAASGRIFEILDTTTVPDDPPGAKTMGPLVKGVSFRDVQFSYGEENDAKEGRVLKGISFDVPAGQTIALVGPSGAGKSTIADLLFRFYDPTGGEISIDGVPLKDIRRESLLDQVAVVNQDPFLFNASIRENIAYGRPNASQEDIEQAARAARIHDDITRLPEGYDTPVGERGVSLSGGQLQRLTIARAILKNASFLLLDEATSNLDTEAEQGVQEALRSLLEQRTALVIAHRQSSIVHADNIVVIDQGRVVEQGKHDQLIGRSGLYARLYARGEGNPVPATSKRDRGTWETEL